jgi:hypothetical protein
VTALLHYWDQPENLSFTASTGKPGGAVDVSGSYQLVVRQQASVKSIAIDLGMVAKTAGFLPEEMALDQHVGFRVGLSVAITPFPAAPRIRKRL